jgi:L-amino acid N-acyltransferase YncA
MEGGEIDSMSHNQTVVSNLQGDHIMKKNTKGTKVKETTKVQSVVEMVKDTEDKVAAALPVVVEETKTPKVVEVRNAHPYRTKLGYRKSKVAKLSRRSIIIKMVHEGKHTKQNIINELINMEDIADKANNRKAVAGTIYDINSNTSCNIKVDANTGICSCLTKGCKYSA